MGGINLSKKTILILIASVVFMFLLFDVSYNKNIQNQVKGGLKINEWIFGLGSVDETNLDKTKLSYSFNLTNENNKSIFIKSIEPLINENIKDKIINKDIVIAVNKDIKPNETIQINGEIIFDTKELSKSDIEKLEPLLIDIKVSTDEIINLIP